MKTAPQHNAPLTGELHIDPKAQSPTQTLDPPPYLADTFPVVLYFKTAQDRDEFIALVRLAKPGLVSRKL